jgi:hypothetical protein
VCARVAAGITDKGASATALAYAHASLTHNVPTHARAHAPSATPDDAPISCATISHDQLRTHARTQTSTLPGMGRRCDPLFAGAVLTESIQTLVIFLGNLWWNDPHGGHGWRPAVGGWWCEDVSTICLYSHPPAALHTHTFTHLRQHRKLEQARQHRHTEHAPPPSLSQPRPAWSDDLGPHRGSG